MFDGYHRCDVPRMTLKVDGRFFYERILVEWNKRFKRRKYIFKKKL
jgi:hypothetical protein